MDGTWTPLNSSSIRQARYLPDSSTLEIQFQTGTAYTLSNVPTDVAEGLFSAGSPGQYFNTHLKGQY